MISVRDGYTLQTYAPTEYNYRFTVTPSPSMRELYSPIKTDGGGVPYAIATTDSPIFVLPNNRNALTRLFDYIGSTSEPVSVVMRTNGRTVECSTVLNDGYYRVRISDGTTEYMGGESIKPVLFAFFTPSVVVDTQLNEYVASSVRVVAKQWFDEDETSVWVPNTTIVGGTGGIRQAIRSVQQDIVYTVTGGVIT